jgi:UDP-N-acetylmuramoylalanine--D-glutamate ligase
LLSFEEPLVVIMGGRDKGADFSELRDLVSARVKRIVLIGEASEAIRLALDGAAVFEPAATMEEAVRKAFAAAGPGEIVLLSPACASFDMFKNYEERGRAFKQAVTGLLREAAS